MSRTLPNTARSVREHQTLFSSLRNLLQQKNPDFVSSPHSRTVFVDSGLFQWSTKRLLISNKFGPSIASQNFIIWRKLWLSTSVSFKKWKLCGVIIFYDWMRSWGNFLCNYHALSSPVMRDSSCSSAVVPQLRFSAVCNWRDFKQAVPGLVTCHTSAQSAEFSWGPSRAGPPTTSSCLLKAGQLNKTELCAWGTRSLICKLNLNLSVRNCTFTWSNRSFSEIRGAFEASSSPLRRLESVTLQWLSDPFPKWVFDFRENVR